MHFQNSCTRNCDHHIFLIITGNAHKQSCHKLWLILKREGIETQSKLMVAFTITRINYLVVSLFCSMVLPLSDVYWHERGCGFPLSDITHCNRCLFRSFQTKAFLLNPVLQIDAIVV